MMYKEGCPYAIRVPWVQKAKRSPLAYFQLTTCKVERLTNVVIGKVRYLARKTLAKALSDLL